MPNMTMLKRFPYVSLAQSLVVLRVAVAVFFMAHALVRLYKGTIPQFGEFLTGKGFPFGTGIVWAITIYEIVAGMCLALGYQVRWMAAGFLFILTMGNILIHASLGWFVGEHGTGGMEYSFSLMVSLLVIAAADRERQQGRP